MNRQRVVPFVSILGRGQTRKEKLEVRSNHCAISDSEIKIYSEYLFVFVVMPSLPDQINEAKGELRGLLNGKGELTERERLLVASLENELASLRAEVAADAKSTRDLRLAEAQRGEMLVCFTTVMLDEFSIDVEINLSHVCHLRLNSFKC